MGHDLASEQQMLNIVHTHLHLPTPKKSPTVSEFQTLLSLFLIKLGLFFKMDVMKKSNSCDIIMGKVTLEKDLGWKHILFLVPVLILSQRILAGMRAASGHWLLRYSLILKKASGWGHYCLITVCDYWHFLQWPYFVRWPICSPENPCSWKFWLTRKYK